MTTMRLDRLLANLAYGSRREVGEAVRGGAFTLDGSPVTDPGFPVPLARVRAGAAMFGGEPLDPVFPLTLLLHKPRGFTCSHDEEGRLIYDLLPPRYRYRSPPLSSAGRLDKDSSGLVILTDDGQMLHRIISPKVHVPKYYRVTLARDLEGGEADLFSTGRFLLAGDPKPIKAALWSPESPRSGTMILQEGRYHQIRRMFETLGNAVETLHRFRIGTLELGALAEGEHRPLTAGEQEKMWHPAPISSAGIRKDSMLDSEKT